MYIGPTYGILCIYSTIKITSEFKSVSLTVGVVDRLALNRLARHGGRGQEGREFRRKRFR